MRLVVIAALFCAWAMAAWAQDVFVLGEIHDNPHHHDEQARRVADIAPGAIVFEMLTPEQADGEIMPQFRDSKGLERRLRWDGSGWPAFEYYKPIFDAAPAARIYGAGVPRKAARRVVAEGARGVFGEAAARYGLTEPLGADMQVAREALQDAAHCGALPPEMLPAMVEVQRLRDAMLSRAALRALDETGGPVAVITGNGHARKDWGVPAQIARVAPRVQVHVLGQTEDDRALDGTFDEVVSHPAIEREDPCAAFR